MTRLQVQVYLVYDIVLRLNIVRIPLGDGVRVCLLACMMGGATRVPACFVFCCFFRTLVSVGSSFVLWFFSCSSGLGMSSSDHFSPPCLFSLPVAVLSSFDVLFFLSLSRCCPLPTFWFVVWLVGLPPFLLVLFVPASVPLVALSLFFFVCFPFSVSLLQPQL